MVGPDNRVTTVSNSKLRMKLTRWIKASPGPTVLHTDAKREARAILRFIKETQVAGQED
jgi:hypothetical protein